MKHFFQMKRLFHWKGLLVGLGLFVAAYAFGHWFVIGGEPYRVARQFIVSERAVSAELGVIQDIGLSWLSSISFTGPSGEANLKCPVVGSTSSGVVYLDLIRESGVWKVDRANLVLAGERTVSLRSSDRRYK
jgi:hypothetical protein